jgi:hypothetical protein
VAEHYDLDADPGTRSILAGPMPTAFDHTRIRIGFWRNS